MDERQQAEQRALAGLFEHEGWGVLMRNTQNQIDQFRTGFPFNINTLEQLYYSRGMMAALQTLLNLEQQFADQDGPEPEPEPNELER